MKLSVNHKGYANNIHKAFEFSEACFCFASNSVIMRL